MKKAHFPVFLVCLVFLAWTMSCTSPSPTGNPTPSPLAQNNQSNPNGNNDTSNDNTSSLMGFLRLILKDAPVDEAKNVYVKIGNIRVHKACDDEEDCFTTVWENTAGQDIDLLALRTTSLIFDETLPVGTYNQIRMAIISGEIVFPSADPAGPSEVRYPLTVPSEEIKTHLHFEVAEGAMTQITLDLDAKNSIHIIKKGKKDTYQLRPVVNVVQVVEGSGN